MGPVAIAPMIVSQVSARAKAAAHMRACVHPRCGRVPATCAPIAVAMGKRLEVRAVVRENATCEPVVAKVAVGLGHKSTWLWGRSVPLPRNVRAGFARAKAAVHWRVCAWITGVFAPWTSATIAVVTAKHSSPLAVVPVGFTQSADLASRARLGPVPKWRFQSFNRHLSDRKYSHRLPRWDRN